MFLTYFMSLFYQLLYNETTTNVHLIEKHLGHIEKRLIIIFLSNEKLFLKFNFKMILEIVIGSIFIGKIIAQTCVH